MATNAIQIFQRIEKKFKLTQSQYEALLPHLLLRMSPDDYCQNGKEYTIYNLYYDTEDNQLIRQSLAKPYYKEKLRLRSYTVPCSLQDKVFLELKKKIGGVVNKRRVVLPLEDAYRFIEYQTPPIVTDYLQQQVVHEIAYFLKNYTIHPTAYIRYDRFALFGKDDRDFRITFDHNIETRRNGLYLEKGGAGKPLLPPDQWLMEIKITRSFPLWLTKTLSDLSIYSTGFSKYGYEYTQYSKQVAPLYTASRSPSSPVITHENNPSAQPFPLDLAI